PYGTGVLIGPREVFEQGIPERSGGGTIRMVTTEQVLWAEPPHKEEAGTPNLAGVVALAEALTVLRELGMSQVVAWEKWLTTYTLRELSQIPGLRVYGTVGAEEDKRVGVISFTMEAAEPALVASILSHEGAVGVRHGCFCAQPYVMSLLRLSSEEKSRLWTQISQGLPVKKPGFVRISLGLYNTEEHIQRLVKYLRLISAGNSQGKYRYIQEEGCYWPLNFDPNPEYFFCL
ncbi:MAG TPA: aminotransferase class V-fold PLP-dependent enzyme, partial [Bacillota bacterium]|nr:aminotransferase class V-fold PLP-dependent enzyme [Bacillota bacterium]